MAHRKALDEFDPADIARYERIIRERSRPALSAVTDDEVALPRAWHVAVTNPRCEGTVAAEMTERGIDTFVPMIRFTRYRSRTHGVGEKPLLPRYVLFRREFASQRLDRIDGFERIVRSSDMTWAKVPERMVHELRVRAVAREFEATRYGTVFMKWLVAQGELPQRAILLPVEMNKTRRQRLSMVARKHGR